MTSTEKAAQKLKDILFERCLNAGLGFRIIAEGDDPGHLGFYIKLDSQRKGDSVVTSQGISVFLDPKTARALNSYEFDYLDGPVGGFLLKKSN